VRPGAEKSLDSWRILPKLLDFLSRVIRVVLLGHIGIGIGDRLARATAWITGHLRRKTIRIALLEVFSAVFSGN
jgi:hypothetical protein